VLRRLVVVGLIISCLEPAVGRATPVAIFYYPWYGTPALDGRWVHWNQNEHLPPQDVYSHFFPARGPYSSGDPAVIDRQMTDIAAAGVDEVVISWWGRGSQEDERLPLLLAAAARHGLAPAIHLEPYPGRSAATVAGDLSYLASLGVRDVYVYHPLELPAADWATLAPRPPGLRLLAGTDRVGFAANGRFDGIYTYDFVSDSAGTFVRLCTEAHAVGLLCAPSVGPGYDGRRAGEPPMQRARRRGALYDALWQAALSARPDLVTITSYNEWGEGTQIEPAQPRAGYACYDGAWGLRGMAAEYAYLTRTTFWTAQAHALQAQTRS
jgi:glycoprotein endo-alpha-1,2-mannosidase